MKSTLVATGTNTKNFAKNISAGTILGTTVQIADSLENLNTTIRKPTGNILKTIENTSHALSEALKNTSKGNILHTIGNTVTLIPRMVGSTGEGLIKIAGHSTQYIAGLKQTSGNSLITAGQQINQSFSTSSESPDIPHKNIQLKDATPLGRNGNHGIVDGTTPKSKFGRWTRNIKNSIFNIPLNIARTGTDFIGAGAQRIRGITESFQTIGTGIRDSRSKVFTKGQSFGQKIKNIFSQGIVGSLKTVGKGSWNIVNEGVLKSGAALLGVGTNLIGRTLGNTIIPLFNTKAREEQKDNIFDETSRHNRFTSYYTSTPISAGIGDTPTESDKGNTNNKQDENKSEQQTDDTPTPTESVTTSEHNSGIANTSSEKQQDEKKNNENNTILGSIAGGTLLVKAIQEAQKSGDKKALDNNAKKLISLFGEVNPSILEVPTEQKADRDLIMDTLHKLENGEYDIPLNENISSKETITKKENNTITKDNQGKIDELGGKIVNLPKDIDPSNITPEVIQSHPDILFLFGDNKEDTGNGKIQELRDAGENSYGITTLLGKTLSDNKEKTQEIIDQAKQTITEDIDKAINYAKLNNVTSVIIPQDKDGNSLITIKNPEEQSHNLVLKQIQAHLQSELERIHNTINTTSEKQQTA